jgi:hypothetical protein
MKPENNIAVTVNHPMNRYNLFVWANEPDGSILVGKTIVWAPDPPAVDFNQPAQEPTLVLSRRAAEELLNQLWVCGVRPTNYEAVNMANAPAKIIEFQKELIDQQSKMIGDLMTEVARLSAPIITMNVSGGKK